jgi:hypothetical protein
VTAAQAHQREGRENCVEDPAARHVERDHPFVADQRDVAPDQPRHVGEERGGQHVDRDLQRPRGAARDQSMDDVHANMAAASHAHHGAEEHDQDEAVGRDLLGPAQAVVEDVAGEELQDQADDDAPEDCEARPVLDRVGTGGGIAGVVFEHARKLGDPRAGVVASRHR